MNLWIQARNLLTRKLIWVPDTENYMACNDPVTEMSQVRCQYVLDSLIGPGFAYCCTARFSCGEFMEVLNGHFQLHDR